MKRFIISIIIFLLIPFVGFSQDSEEKKKEKKMDDVVVTAGRINESKKEITTSVIVIDQKDIKNSAANDLADLLAQKAGIYIKKYPGTLSSPGIRGFKSDTHGNDLSGETLIMIDGRRTGTGSIAKLLTKNIERVEIVKGSASVQYGSSAVGGVINVITKRGKEKKEISIESKYGSYDFSEISGGFSGKTGKFDLSLNVSESKQHSYKTGDHEKYYNTGYDSIIHYSFNAGFEFIKDNRLGVILTGFDGNEIGTPNSLSSNDKDDYKNTSNISYDFSYEGKSRDKSLLWKLKYFKVEDKNRNYDMPTSDISKTDTDLYGIQGQFSAINETSSITGGVDYLSYETTKTNNPKYHEYENIAGFVLGKLYLMDHNLILSGGARYDEHILTYSGTETDQDKFCPSVGFGYFVTDDIKLRINYSEAYAVPDGFSLYADDTYWGTHYQGNPDLKPEKSNTYEGGIDFYYNENNISLTYFHINFEDKIESYNLTATEVRYRNADSVTTSGIEFSYSKLYKNLFSQDLFVKPYFNCTLFTKYEDKNGDKLSQTADQTYSMGMNISGFQGFSSDLNLHYTGRQIAYGSTIQKPYTVINISTSKRLKFEKIGNITVRGEVKNLSDVNYESVYGYPMPGRTFYMSLRYDF